MKIQIGFKFRGNQYRFTVDENEVDTCRYEDVWSVCFGCEDNEMECRDGGYVFKITADKLYIEDKKASIISGNDIYVNVYENANDGECVECIAESCLEVLYM